MELYKWSDVAEEQLNPLATRQMIHTATMTIARLKFKKGFVVPTHSHDNEQITTVEEGSMQFDVAGKRLVVKAGESICIPPNVLHSAETLEESVSVDVFCPRREDWVSGDDAYLR